MFLVKRRNFNKINIIKGLSAAIFFSAFIYFEYFGFDFKLLNSLLAFLAIYYFLKIPRNSMFVAGFFIGTFWFYWISFSFVYYELKFAIPFVVLGLGFIYGLLFYFIGYLENVFYRATLLFLLSFVSILGFNWLQIELILLNSYFGIEKLNLAIFIFSIALFAKYKKWYFLLFLVFALNFSSAKQEMQKHNLKIYMPQFNIAQEKKWDEKYQEDIIFKNLKEIDFAIKNKYDLIILPEAAFPIVLNQSETLLNVLKEKSQYLDIVAGAINNENGQFYNSSYHFSKENLIIANKVVLVPFGEEIPLPKFLKDFINNIFYNGASDFSKAKNPTDFDIKGIKFRNAICYETTTKEIFKNLNEVKYMISISNNAWFTPSIEPILQKLLMQYYAKIYNVSIYASTNGSDNFIIEN